MSIDCNARKRILTKHNGEKVAITVERVEYLREGRNVKEHTYITTHVGKVRNGVFYEGGSMRSFAYRTGTLLTAKRLR